MPSRDPITPALFVLLLAGCVAAPDGGRGEAPWPPAIDDDDSADDDDTVDDDDSAEGDDTTTGDDDDSVADCPDGMICVEDFPFLYSGDTSLSSLSDWDSYGCSPSTDERGPEQIFRITVPEDGFLTALVEEDDGVDVDLHFLRSLDPSDCLDRGNRDARADVEAGTVYVVVDSWFNGQEALAGGYNLGIGLTVPFEGDCAMQGGSIDRIGDGGIPLPMPTTGPIVLEAHLVTTEDGYGSAGAGPWPATATEGLDVHYAGSQALSGFMMHREQNWAPQESSLFGQGASYDKLPQLDEHWYVNMYWRQRPAEGTRMILQDASGRAVVLAAGYETGPGDLDHPGGATEEAHHYLGTGHLSVLTLGFAVDQDLPLGPIRCP